MATTPTPAPAPQQDPWANLSMYDIAQMQMPGYQSAYNPNTMSMMDYLQKTAPQYDSGYNEFKSQATSKAPSAWYNISRNLGDLKEKDLKDKGAQDVAGANAKARGDLAAQGGLTSGARERIAEQGQKSYLSMAQDTGRQGLQNDLQLGITDAGNKMQMLGQLPGMEQNRLNMFETARQNDISNQMNETQRQNQYNMDVYGKKMDAIAAEKQAQATENSGKK